ncbi:hypothetical protein PG991_008878 [Apiospora marii]|uniref:Uncharacterized protein n=1 Tax=Apiospora marii TaxID=335849 RepID=A0ABR1RM06_9PEZI
MPLALHQFQHQHRHQHQSRPRPQPQPCRHHHPVSWPQFSGGDHGTDGIPVWDPWIEKFGLPALLASYVLGVLCRWVLAFAGAREALRDSLLISRETYDAAVSSAAGRKANDHAAANQKDLTSAYTVASAAVAAAAAAAANDPAALAAASQSLAEAVADAGDHVVAGRAAAAGLEGAATAANATAAAAAAGPEPPLPPLPPPPAAAATASRSGPTGVLPVVSLQWGRMGAGALRLYDDEALGAARARCLSPEGQKAAADRHKALAGAAHDTAAAAHAFADRLPIDAPEGWLARAHARAATATSTATANANSADDEEEEEEEAEPFIVEALALTRTGMDHGSSK